jgi:anaerobic nitric oxide reductase transcription regulator
MTLNVYWPDSMKLSASDLTQITVDLNSGISAKDRFARLLNTIRKVIRCDASALLVLQGKQLKPLAINGLSPDVLGRRFLISEHPRLESIARAGEVVRFPAESDLPDPYDGLIPNQGDQLNVHACVGLPLLVNEHLIGVLTIDGFDETMFNDFDDEDLQTLSALAAASLNNALMMEKLEKRVATGPTAEPELRTDLVDTTDSNEMIGESASMQALKNGIAVVARSDLNVLILGETGVGKELVALAIQKLSSRSSKPLVYLNCAALPEAIAESELFGHVKGAFTGAISNRSGKFETADQGTLFLDEIGELPISLQVKLLRVLQYGDIQRIGDDLSHKVDVRIIAATNKDLKHEIDRGRFRADLFHRLSVFPIQVPPLRERDGDIPLLAGFFVERCRVKLGLHSLRISSSGFKQLNSYDWPGNVRELEHAIYRAAILAEAETGRDNTRIGAHHFDLGETGTVSAGKEMKSQMQFEGGLREQTDVFQRQLVMKVHEENQGNWAATARDLDIDSGNLHRLAGRLGLK